MKNKFIPLALANFALSAAPAHAAIIARYLFNDADFTNGAASSTPETASTADNFVRSTTTGLGFSTGSDNAFAQTHLNGTIHPDVAAAVSYGNFFSFTVTPVGGQRFDLTSLTYTSIHNDTAGGTEAAANTTATMNFFVRSSVDGFAANVGSTFSQAYNTTTPLRTLDLSGASFQDVTDPVTFRFYAFESVELSTRQGARWDDVVLNGTTEPIPEPSAALLGGIGALLLLRRRR